MNEDLENQHMAQAEFARLVHVAEGTIAKHVRNGTLQKDTSGKLRLGPNLRAYLTARKKDLRLNVSVENTSAKLRAATARVELEKRRLAKLEAETLPAKRV